jgi:two-component system invasion response regulator UvrY
MSKTPYSGGELLSEILYMQKETTVIIADDNWHMREILKVILSPLENIRLVGEATNGEEVIKLASESNPDIILLDINMAPLNGFEAARKILNENPSIRIIALSLHRDASYCRNMLRLGAKGYVTKSSPYEEIIGAINVVAAGGIFIDKNITGMD